MSTVLLVRIKVGEKYFSEIIYWIISLDMYSL